MKCVVCGKRKAKRSCPAKGASICPLCCGEKRVLELNCPETCKYLKTGREHESAEFSKKLWSQDKLKQERNRRILSDYQDVVAHLEYIIAQQRLLSRDLSDKDVSSAVNILLDVYRTEDKGILYEKNSDDLRVEALRPIGILMGKTNTELWIPNIHACRCRMLSSASNFCNP
jgi:hypothetical protein